jgi:hypothetical protein
MDRVAVAMFPSVVAPAFGAAVVGACLAAGVPFLGVIDLAAAGTHSTAGVKTSVAEHSSSVPGGTSEQAPLATPMDWYSGVVQDHETDIALEARA